MMGSSLIFSANIEGESEDKGGSKDSDEGESDLVKLKAIQNWKTRWADNSAIDPKLLHPLSSSPQSLPGSNVSKSTTAISQVDSVSLAQLQASFPHCCPGTIPLPRPTTVPHGDEHGCRSQHVSNSNSTSVKHLSLLPSPIASSQPTLPRSIHHLLSIIHHQWQLLISSLLNYRLDFLDIQ